MNRFDSSDIVIHDIDQTRYYRDGIHPLNLEANIISMGLNPELLRSKETMRLWK